MTDASADDDDSVWALHTALTGIREGYEIGKSHLPPRSAFSEAYLVALYDAVANGERDPEALLALMPGYARHDMIGA